MTAKYASVCKGHVDSFGITYRLNFHEPANRLC